MISFVSLSLVSLGRVGEASVCLGHLSHLTGFVLCALYQLRNHERSDCTTFHRRYSQITEPGAQRQ